MCGIVCKIIFVQPPGKNSCNSQLGLSNWKLCVLLLQFLINFKRFAGQQRQQKQQAREGNWAAAAAALLAADLWQWQIKPMGVATTLLQPSSICVCDMRARRKKRCTFPSNVRHKLR